MSILSGPELYSLIEVNKSKLRLSLGEFLGVGKHGCVYRLDTETVVKFTVSPSEIDMAEYLLESEPISGFPEVYEIIRLKLPGYDRPTIAIVKEDVSHIDALNKNLLNSVMNLFGVVDNRNTIDASKDILYSQLEKELKSEYSVEEEIMLIELTDFLVWCLENFIYLSDVIKRNLGIRISSTGQTHVVLRDFSTCDIG